LKSTQFWIMIKKKQHEVTTIYVVRHGESQSNVYAHENPDKPASHFGEFGSSLTEKGKEQAHTLAQKLKTISFSAFFSSDLNRAKETAEIIASYYGMPVTCNRILRERFFGEPMSNVKKKTIEKALDQLTDEEKFAFKYFPNGESGQDVVNRFQNFLKEITYEYKSKTILVVSHSYVMRSFLIHAKFAKFDELKGGTIKNAGYFVIEMDENSFRIVDKHGITRNRGYDDEE
jgi:broad specificity phosphatase PhoE